MSELLIVELIKKLVMLYIVINSIENSWLLLRFSACLSRTVDSSSISLPHFKIEQFLTVVQGVLAAIILLELSQMGSAAILITICIIQFTLNYQSTRYRYQAADKNQLSVLLVTISVSTACKFSPVIITACICFITAHTILAYCSSGLCKLLSPEWRRGEWLQLILSKSAYKSPWVTRIVDSSPANWRILSWAVILFEVFSPLMLVLPRELMYAYIVLACAFHLSNFLIWGFNHFFWVFLASLPAIAWCNHFISQLVD